MSQRYRHKEARVKIQLLSEKIAETDESSVLDQIATRPKKLTLKERLALALKSMVEDTQITTFVEAQDLEKVKRITERRLKRNKRDMDSLEVISLE